MTSPVLLRPAASRRPASARARAVISAASLRTGPISSAPSPVSSSKAGLATQSSTRAACSSPPGHPVTGPNLGPSAVVRRWKQAGSLAPGNRQAMPMIATDPP
jgi:hypothetical protein